MLNRNTKTAFGMDSRFHETSRHSSEREERRPASKVLRYVKLHYFVRDFNPARSKGSRTRTPVTSDASPTEHPPPPLPAAPPVGLTLGALVTVTLGPAVGETEGAPVTVGATVGATVGVGVDSSGTAVTIFDVPSCAPPTTTSANQYWIPPVSPLMVTVDVVLVRFTPVTVL